METKAFTKTENGTYKLTNEDAFVLEWNNKIPKERKEYLKKYANPIIDNVCGIYLDDIDVSEKRINHNNFLP